MLSVTAALAAVVVAWTPLPLERVQAEPPLAGRSPLQARISPAGRHVTFLKASATSSEVLDLWAQPLPSGSPMLLVSSSDLLSGKAQKITEAERMALERKRISQRGITSYGWCGDDDTRVLLPFSGDLYLATLSGTSAPPTVKRLTTDDDVPEQNPVCNDDGTKVAYVKRGNVVIHDIKTNQARGVSKGASATRSFGLAEFIAEEELDRHEGFWWSHDGRQLLFLEVDESPVGVKVRPQIFADHTEMVSQRYPAAGEHNAVVTPHLYTVATGKRVTVALPRTGPRAVEYVARAGFFNDGTAWLQTLSRDQTRLSLLEINGTSGALRTIVDDIDSAWVDVHDDLHEFKDGTLLWSSEASGRKQLERIDRATGKRTPLTTLDEAVSEVVCVDDDDTVVMAAFQDRGRALHLLARAPDGTVRALTTGKRSASASADSACRHLLVTQSAWGVPPSTSMMAVNDGRILGVIGEASDGPAVLLTQAVPAAPRFLDLVAADGTTVINGLWLPPAPGKVAAANGSVPVITHAYGGPTGQVVSYRWARTFPLFTHWQQQGFGVFLVDTRGMAGRDRTFTRAHKHAFGQVEVDDVKAAIRQLPQLFPEVDSARVGFFGWSYGGYLAARLALDADRPVAAAAAVAPVTDWRLYDTAYTERYIGQPGEQGDAADYATSNLLTRAGLLNTPLLLMHGTADDNVLFEHTLRLIQALQDEGKVFETSIYPGKAHGIAGKSSQLHVHKTLSTFFADKLQR
jgi:dipeptidyl-peptidase-4